MRRILAIVFIASLIYSCGNGSEYVNDFYVPSLPFNDGVEQLNEGQGGVKYTFELFKYQYFMWLDLDQQSVMETLEKPKTIDVYEDEELSDQEFNELFYSQFLSDDNDVYTLEEILSIIGNRTVGTDFDLVQVLVSFVQGIPYEEAGPQKYPLETLSLNKGDCSDKSILLAKLLSMAGYDACLFIYEEAKHMAVGLKVDQAPKPYYHDYIYIESTGYHPIGDIPAQFAGGITIKEDPIVVLLDQGQYAIYGFSELTQLYDEVQEYYGPGYFNTTIEGKRITEEITSRRKTLDSLTSLNEEKENKINDLMAEYNRLDCSQAKSEAIYEECQVIVEASNDIRMEYNDIIKQQNEIIEEFNRLTNRLNKINANNYIKE